MSRLKTLLLACITSAAVLLAACGGGGGSPGSSAMNTPLGASLPVMSSGSITAFGSVFVDGREFDVRSAQVIDDDTATTTADTSALEVGMEVDVKTALGTAAAQPVATEIHLHPLARGYVDTSDMTGGTLTVMGQTISLTSATVFSDHRACLAATPAPCTAIAGQSGLTATTGSGATAQAGNYVTVHGYLYSATAGAASSIVATLVVVDDAPTGSVPAAFKAEGLAVTATGSTLTIGSLTVNLSAATCYAGSGAVPCAGAYSAGQVVSVFAPTAPALPATSFAAQTARLRSQVPAASPGAEIEVEGKAASVTTAPAAFVLRGLSIDASALPAASLPATGDLVRVVGTISAQGTSLLASSVTVLHAARNASFGFEADAGTVALGSSANTYTLTLLGQAIGVDATARLADRSGPRGSRGDSASNPFNIGTFKTYLAASASRHLLVRTQANALGALTAMSVTIVPAAATAGISGSVDATPAPVNPPSAAALPTTFAIHGVPVSASAGAIVFRPGRNQAAITAVAAGDYVQVRGTATGNALTVASATKPTATNFVVDFGASSGTDDHDCF